MQPCTMCVLQLVSGMTAPRPPAPPCCCQLKQCADSQPLPLFPCPLCFLLLPSAPHPPTHLQHPGGTDRQVLLWDLSDGCMAGGILEHKVQEEEGPSIEAAPERTTFLQPR